MILTQDSDIQHLLETTRTIAVVGYSNKPDRPSNGVTWALERAGFDVYKVNPLLASDSPEKIYASLADVPVVIDLVDVFRRSADVPPVVEDAIAVGAKAVWLQSGIVNEDAARRANEAGLDFVMDRCTKVEYSRLVAFHR